MVMLSYTYEQIFAQTPLSIEDMAYIEQCRGEHNRLGFAYQLTFVRLLNRFPIQEPLELAENIITFATIQLGIPSCTSSTTRTALLANKAISCSQ